MAAEVTAKLREGERQQKRLPRGFTQCATGDGCGSCAAMVVRWEKQQADLVKLRDDLSGLARDHQPNLHRPRQSCALAGCEACAPHFDAQQQRIH